jgi:hypothetical protein
MKNCNHPTLAPCCANNQAVKIQHLAQLLGVKYDGKMLDFPTSESFSLVLEKTQTWIEDLEGPKTSTDLFPGFWSMEHELNHQLEQRLATWKAGKLKENEKTEPLVAKFPASQALRLLLNSVGRAKIQGSVVELKGDGQVLLQDEKGNFQPSPEDRENSGGPKSLCCMTSFNKVEIQTVNATDRMVCQLQLHRISFLNLFIFGASSTYQRVVQSPTQGTVWLDCNTPHMGVALFGATRATCSDASPLINIPSQTPQVYNKHRVSATYQFHGTHNTRVGRLASIHGCFVVPGHSIYAC